jgi:hypothetical protein
MLDLESGSQKGSFEDVLKGIATEIPDMGIVIDGGAAGVHSNLARLDGLEFVHSMG